jgi:PglZ domain.
MTLAASTTSQIRAKVATLYKKRPDDRIIGIRTAGQWMGNERVTIDGNEFRIVQCDSTLQIRELLIETDGDSAPVVVVTNLSDTEIGLDLLVRFARRRLHTLQAWQILKELFQARTVDPTLLNKSWLAEALLETAPAEGYKPVPSGTLNQETVWAILLRDRLGFTVARPDARDLLAWTLAAENIARYLAMPAEMREGVQGWIRESVGSVADLIFACLDAGYGEEAAPIGLVCQIVFGEMETAELREAAVRLERFTGNRPIAREDAERWAAAAADLVEKQSHEQPGSEVIRLLERSDRLLKEIRADAFAHLSQYSPVGFEMRLERFGQCLYALVTDVIPTVSDELLELTRAVFQHHKAQQARERTQRIAMAIRLLEWLGRHSVSESGSFAEAANRYLRDSGFVDWARCSLDGSDGVRILAQAYALVIEKVTTHREAENKRFAELLVNWTEAGSVGDAVMGVEDVLREVVSKAAQAGPVLLIVIDGMSMAVFRELIADVSSKGWAQWGIAGTEWPRPVIAALPSVTEVSRTSLLCGRLASGASRDEISGFSKNAELLKVCKAPNLPVLFHKASLTEMSGLDLAPEVRREIASDKRKIVGIVVNAVDDNLAKSNQVAIQWGLKHIPVLEQLLYAARDSGRVVIVTSDHGHVIERQTKYRKSEPGERYRMDDGKPLHDEFLIAGSRVLGPSGNRLIAPWSEAVRYGGKKHGYHGGLTPQECVIPLAVLTWQHQVLNGWTELNLFHPEWWNVVNQSI